MNKIKRKNSLFTGWIVLFMGCAMLIRADAGIAGGEYKEGVGSMLELIDARTTYVDAQRSYIDALAEYRLAWAKLERSIGVIK